MTTISQPHFCPENIVTGQYVWFESDILHLLTVSPQAAYSAGATALTVAYGQYVRTPKWTARRTWVLGIAANVLGLVVGQVKRASAHLQFVKSLENQQGFLSALHEIAGEKPLPGPAPQQPSSTRSAVTEEYGSDMRPSEAESAWTTSDLNPPSTAVTTSAAPGKRCCETP